MSSFSYYFVFTLSWLFCGIGEYLKVRG